MKISIEERLSEIWRVASGTERPSHHGAFRMTMGSCPSSFPAEVIGNPSAEDIKGEGVTGKENRIVRRELKC